MWRRRWGARRGRWARMRGRWAADAGEPDPCQATVVSLDLAGVWFNLTLVNLDHPSEAVALLESSSTCRLDLW